MTNGENPLKKYYRNTKLSIRLPSGGKYYADDVLVLDENEEISILPMTAQDEITLQNPDALLTGKAVTDVIKSCAPAIKLPRNLLACDIDVLMIAIRVASYGDEAEMEIHCPECTGENSYSMNLELLLNQTDTLEEHYEVVLDNNLTIFIKPGTFSAVVRQQKTAFENSKLEDIINSPNISDDEGMKVLSQVFERVAKLNFELILDSIDKIVFTDEEGKEQEIDNRKYISEWLHNIDKVTIGKIETKIFDVNKVGIAKTIPVTCKLCDNKWDARIEFNPVNFS